MTKIGRNDPCSCGSGKKYKKCCMGNEMPAGLKYNTDLVSGFAEMSKELMRMLVELHSKHEAEFTGMSSEEKISISRKIFSDERFDKYNFTYETMYKVIRKYGQPPNPNDPKSIDKMIAYMKKGIKERYTDRDLTSIGLELYLLVPEFFNNNQYRECWAIEAANESIMDFKDGKKAIPLFFLDKFMDGMELYQETKYKKHHDIFNHIGLNISDLDETEGDILQKVKDLSITEEQERLMSEYFEQNRDIKNEVEKSIEEDEKIIVKLLESGELDQALFNLEEMEPQVKELGERFEELQLPEQKGNMGKKKNKEARDVMFELIDKWLPELFTEDRWKYIISCFNNKLEELKAEREYDKYKALANLILLLTSSGAEREYIGRLIIGASLKNVSREHSEKTKT